MTDPTAPKVPPQTIPITDNRKQRRRSTDHTPEDCYKLLNTQAVLESVRVQQEHLAVMSKQLDASLLSVLAIIEKGAASHARVEARLEATVTDIEQINAKLLDGNERFAKLEDAQHKSAEDRERLEVKLDKVLNVLTAGEGFFKVVGWLAGAAKPLVTLVVLIGGAYAAFTGTQHLPK